MSTPTGLLPRCEEPSSPVSAVEDPTRQDLAEVEAGWEDKLVAPNTTATFFAKNTPHQVIAPNKVVELKENSVVLEKPFEGSTELPFFVSHQSPAITTVNP